MKTRMVDMFGIDVPIFAFSHCRDVVVEVSKAGGMGVLGVGYFTPQQLREELNWIESRIDGKPYGIDVLLPGKYQQLAAAHVTFADIPKLQADYMRRYLDEGGIPRLPEDRAEEMISEAVRTIQMTREQSLELLGIALDYDIKLVVNALGAPPRELVDDLHARGVKVGGVVGKVEHAFKHREAGVDLLVAQGSEAGGHTGTLTSMLLWPQVVDAVHPLPVLAAGGIGNGRQIAAALALGAEGVWAGSLWLTTAESEVVPELKQRLLEARSEEAVQRRARTGKPVRVLRSKLMDAYETPDAPPILPMPLQTASMMESNLRVERARARDWLYSPVGQVVGLMKEELTCRQVMYNLMLEYADAVERMEGINAR